MRTRGFTLIEMLVTIALMGVMALICWRGLAWIAGQRDAVGREAAELAQIVRTFAQLERDLAERLPDAALPPPRAATELPPAVGVAPAQAGAAELEILRFVPQAAGRPRAQRVLYRVAAGGLVRSTWPLDGAGADPSEVLLLPGASALRVRVHAGGFWLRPGEPRVQPAVRAAALEIAVEDAGGARYVRVLVL